MWIICYTFEVEEWNPKCVCTIQHLQQRYTQTKQKRGHYTQWNIEFLHKFCKDHQIKEVIHNWKLKLKWNLVYMKYKNSISSSAAEAYKLHTFASTFNLYNLHKCYNLKFKLWMCNNLYHIFYLLSRRISNIFRYEGKPKTKTIRWNE